MPLATRITDATVGTCDIGEDCCPHGRRGTNAEGSQLLDVEGQAAHLVGHTGPCNCPHGGTFESVEGSKLIEAEGKALTLTGQATVCRSCGKSGHHETGSKLLETDF